MVRASQDGPLFSSPAKPSTFNAQKTSAPPTFSNPRAAARFDHFYFLDTHLQFLIFCIVFFCSDVSASSEFNREALKQSQLPPRSKPRFVGCSVVVVFIVFFFCFTFLICSSFYFVHLFTILSFPAQTSR